MLKILEELVGILLVGILFLFFGVHQVLVRNICLSWQCLCLCVCLVRERIVIFVVAQFEILTVFCRKIMLCGLPSQLVNGNEKCRM